MGHMRTKLLCVMVAVLLGGVRAALADDPPDQRIFHSVESALEFSEQARYLDLSFQKLKTLPPTITKLSHLETLNLRGNQFTRVPEGVSVLQNLHTLDLNNNQLHELPRNFSKLTHLITLFAADNHLTAIPRELALCPHLALLIVDNNQLTHLPDELAHLTELREVLAFGNAIPAAEQSQWQSKLPKVHWVF